MIQIPESVTLSPQERRVFAVLQDWADVNAIRRAINEPDGTPRYTPPAIILSKLKTKLEKTTLTIESNKHAYDRSRGRAWRLVEISQARAA